MQSCTAGAPSCSWLLPLLMSSASLGPLTACSNFRSVWPRFCFSDPRLTCRCPDRRRHPIPDLYWMALPLLCPFVLVSLLRAHIHHLNLRLLLQQYRWHAV